MWKWYKQNVVTDTLTNNEPTHVLVWTMKPIFHPCQRFPADVIRHAAWLYLPFTWNVRDIEDLPADCKQKVSNELIRRWILNFWPLISKNLRETRPRA
jgi:transposase-like protein